MEQFIELVQVAIGTRDELLQMPTEEEWNAIFNIALQQGLIGITYVGVKKLMRQSGCTLSQKLLLKWSGYSVQLSSQNAHVSTQGERVLQHFHDAGFQAIILKGQSHRKNYPEFLRDYRTPGDIDVWVRGDSKKHVYQFVHKDFPEAEYTYLHIHFPVFSDTLVEVHYRPSYLLNPLYNCRIQKWSNSIDIDTLQEERVFRNFNSIFQPLHLYRHLAWEGITLRQLLDYYFLLKQQPVIDYEGLERFGILRFQKDLNDVVYHLFENIPLRTPSSKKLCDDILIYGKLGINPIKRTRYRFLHLFNSYSKGFVWMPFAMLYHIIWHFYVRLFY